jgi:hypothetical protein
MQLGNDKKLHMEGLDLLLTSMVISWPKKGSRLVLEFFRGSTYLSLKKKTYFLR